MKSVGHNARAQRSSDRADARWEEDTGESVEALHRIDHMLAIGAITGEERERLMEALFPGFSKVSSHVAEGWRGKPERNIREYVAEERDEEVVFRQLYGT